MTGFGPVDGGSIPPGLILQKFLKKFLLSISATSSRCYRLFFNTVIHLKKKNNLPFMYEAKLIYESFLIITSSVVGALISQVFSILLNSTLSFRFQVTIFILIILSCFFILIILLFIFKKLRILPN